MRALLSLLVLVANAAETSTTPYFGVDYGQIQAIGVPKVQGYGVGNDSCATYVNEFDAHRNTRVASADYFSYYQWLAGYFTALNMHTAYAKVIPDFNAYMAVVASVCRDRPVSYLIDAAQAAYLQLPDAPAAE